MASIVSETLFGSESNRDGRRDIASCNSSPRTRFRNMFGLTPQLHSSPMDDYGGTKRIDPGPPPLLPDMGYVGDDSRALHVSGFGDKSVKTGRDLMRWKVVKENDAHRGFRMFDGILMNVKDVSSEELFLERMKIAYSAYEAYVSRLVDKSPLEITKALVHAVSACLVKYFSNQSMLRTNRPFIAKVLNLEGTEMFCSHSDFMRSFLFTNASADDEAIISLAEKVYAENNFDVCYEADANIGQQNGGTNHNNTVTDQLFDFGMRIAERSVVGGTNASIGSRKQSSSHFATLSDELPFQQRKDGAGRTIEGGTTAMLIVVTDLEALHNYVAYVLYLTPTLLTRRYDINFDCLRRPTMSDVNADCCRAREAKKRKHDDTKVVIRAVIEKKRREKIDTMTERSAACEATVRQHATQTLKRNNDLLCHVLLMLFDKCLTGIIDKGFENLNRRRGYAVNSAKEIGAATIYTGIIDTVGEVSTRIEGYTFDQITANDISNKDSEKDVSSKVQPHLRFSLPLSSIVTEVSNSTSNRRNIATTDNVPEQSSDTMGSGSER